MSQRAGGANPAAPDRNAASRPLVLASGSPRRRQLLARAGIDFEVRPVDIPEVRAAGETPECFALRLAREKALAGAHALGDSGEAPPPVLGADTIVVLGEDVLGKPRDPEDAVRMLGRLVGRSHVVTTAVAVVAGPARTLRTLCVHSRVRMRPADESELRAYVATGESLDKAGAYALQGRGRRFVEAVEGSETNVIGLPLEETLALLQDVGIDAGRAGAAGSAS
jgi:septum formation protein